LDRPTAEVNQGDFSDSLQKVIERLDLTSEHESEENSIDESLSQLWNTYQQDWWL